MSVDLWQELDRFTKLDRRPLSCQIEYMIALAKMVIESCDGSDNLKVVEDQLKKAKEALEKAEK